LTIKLTQHVPVGSRQGPYRTSDGGSCIPPLRILQGGMRPFNAISGEERTHTRHEEASSPFHKTLLSSKICGFCATRTLKFAQRNAYFLQLSKIVRSAHQFPIGTSPLPAERRIGLEPMLRAIKNPATSAGRIRPSPGRHFRAPLGRMCSKLVFFLSGVRNQPHLWMSRQARSVSRLPCESGRHQLQSSIPKSKIPSSCIQDFFTLFLQPTCEFHMPLWKSIRLASGPRELDHRNRVYRTFMRKG
jgi:hypothetical protein